MDNGKLIVENGQIIVFCLFNFQLSIINFQLNKR